MNSSSNSNNSNRFSSTRRQLLKRGLLSICAVFVSLGGLYHGRMSWAKGVRAPTGGTSPGLNKQETASPPQQRFALLVGIGNYPAPHDLPSMSRNVTDLSDALSGRGFDVTCAMDLDRAALEDSIRVFVARLAAAPPDAVALFYYSGHGVQVSANNLLLGAGTRPDARREELLSGAVALQQALLAAMPPRPAGLNLTVIDACRTQLNGTKASGAGHALGFNQVAAPTGSIVCFSTAAGRPAIAPADPNQNTFFTASLVKILRVAEEWTGFDELLHRVKQDVEVTMKNHPLEAIRQVAQSPFIADNSRVRVALGLPAGGLMNLITRLTERERLSFEQLEQEVWPVDLLQKSREFISRFPDSPVRSKVALILDGAQQALTVLKSREVRLFKSSFTTPADVPEQVDDLRRAARGDKDAAARIAGLYRDNRDELSTARYEGWLQFASGLGNGIACYELALHYRVVGQSILAAQAEAQARLLGYTPPRTLGSDRK